MAYIVDGNNVFGQTPGWHRDKQAARLRLLESVALFARIKKASVTVVFDGAPDSRIPEGSTFRGVKVTYARKGSDADHRIEQMVESSRDRRGLIVVTSDRRLAVEVRALGATTIRSGEFRKLIEETIRSKPSAEDGEEFQIEDVNSWMRYFGVPTAEDDAG